MNYLSRKGRYRLYAIVSLFVCLISFNIQEQLAGNPASRLAAAESLVNAGTFAIDESPFRGTVDKVKVNGTFYSSKPPFTYLGTAAAYFVLSKVFGMKLSKDFSGVYYYLVFITTLAPYLILIFYMYNYLKRAGFKEIDLLICLGIFLFTFYGHGYLVDLNNHTLAAIFLFGGFYHLETILINRASPKDWVLAAILSSLVSLSDVPAAFFLACVGAYLFVLKPKTFFKYFAPAGSLVLACGLALNYIVFDSLLPPYFNKSLYLYEGSYWLNPAGTDALSENKLVYAFHLLLGHHGIFSFSPILLIGLGGFIKKGRQRKLLPIEKFIALSTLGMLLLYIFNTSNYGGVCVGFRWFVPWVPILYVLFFQAYKIWRQERWFQILVIITGAWGFFNMLDVAFLPWRTGTLHKMFL